MFPIFLPSFHRVLFSSDDFALSYRLSKIVTNMNPGHVKGVHDVNEVAIFWFMNFTFREIHFLSNYSSRKSNRWLVPMYTSFVHILTLTLIILCNNVNSLSSSRGSLINVNVFSQKFDFDPRPVSFRINLHFPQTFCTT